MKTLYAGKIIRVYHLDGNYHSVIPKKDFDKLLKKGLTRKKAKDFNIGSRLYNNSYSYHYSKNDIEKQRIDKIKTTNSINRFNLWEEHLEKLEILSPGITKRFKKNIRKNPGLISKELDTLNDLFYEMKLFTRQSKKYIRQGCKRKNQVYYKSVSNTSEYLLKKILKELELNFEVQPYLENKWFDFKVGEYMIELDGPQYHTSDKDEIKNKLANKYGYKVIRILTSELNDITTLKKKLKKCLHKAK